ncbi:hypothetical protein OAY52_04275 [Gammaproteobacteria bacterium]|nr:hypothetical protein [Gammaproteobacteria bacterium]
MIVSSIPSNASPTNSNFELMVAEPELPFVISRVDRKFTGTELIGL